MNVQRFLRAVVFSGVFLASYAAMSAPSWTADEMARKQFTFDPKLATLKLEYVDFKIPRGRTPEAYGKDIGRYDFKLFGCKRMERKVVLDEGRAMRRDMNFDDVFFEVLSDHIPVVVSKNSPYFEFSVGEVIPGYVMTAEIEDLYMNVCDQYDWRTRDYSHLRSGTSEIRVRWRLMSPFSRKLRWEDVTYGYGEIVDPIRNGETRLVEKAFADALVRVMGMPGFLQTLGSIPNDREIHQARSAYEAMAYSHVQRRKSLTSSYRRRRLRFHHERERERLLESLEKIGQRNENLVEEILKRDIDINMMTQTEVDRLIAQEVELIQDAVEQAQKKTEMSSETPEITEKPKYDLKELGEDEEVERQSQEDKELDEGIENRTEYKALVQKIVEKDIARDKELDEGLEIRQEAKVLVQKTVEKDIAGDREIDGRLEQGQMAKVLVQKAVEKDIYMKEIEGTLEQGQETKVLDQKKLIRGQEGSALDSESVEQKPVEEITVTETVTVEVEVETEKTTELAEGPESRETPQTELGAGGAQEGMSGRVLRQGKLLRMFDGYALSSSALDDGVAATIYKDSDLFKEGPPDFTLNNDLEFKKSGFTVSQADGYIVIAGQKPFRYLSPPRIYRIRSSVVAVTSEEEVGSGLLIAPSLVLTNYSIARKSPYTRVEFLDGRTLPAVALRANRDKDVALLYIPPMQFSSSTWPIPLRLDLPDVGEKFYAIGTPMRGGFEGAMEEGRVAGYRYSDTGVEILTNTTVQSVTLGGTLVDEFGNATGLARSGRNMLEVRDGFIPIGDAFDVLKVRVRDVNPDETPWQKALRLRREGKRITK